MSYSGMAKSEVIARVRLGTYVVNPERVADAMVRRGLMVAMGYDFEVSNREKRCYRHLTEEDRVKGRAQSVANRKARAKQRKAKR